MSCFTHLGFAVGSLLLSLLLAEVGATQLHHGAFPYLNIFQVDARYGVRLIPNTSTKVRSRHRTITEIRTNSLGFRGPEWPNDADRRDRILLVGDSQMLGYGVAWEDALPAQLERALAGRAVVLDAAVPSWGPSESVLAVEEYAPRYRPHYVLFVANAANDWFETVPNTLRTSARDGWAARPGPPPIAFPGRELLLGRSHLTLAMAQLTHHLGGPELPPAESIYRLVRDLPELRRVEGAHRSRLAAPLLAAVQGCQKVGCTVVAVALPLDAQVDSSEWKKYRVAPEDLSATEVLLDDFVADARAAGLPAINLLSTLRAVEPGAFLADDYHLAARGHRAVADAIARLLQS